MHIAWLRDQIATTPEDTTQVDSATFEIQLILLLHFLTSNPSCSDPDAGPCLALSPCLPLAVLNGGIPRCS